MGTTQLKGVVRAVVTVDVQDADAEGASNVTAMDVNFATKLGYAQHVTAKRFVQVVAARGGLL